MSLKERISYSRENDRRITVAGGGLSGEGVQYRVVRLDRPQDDDTPFLTADYGDTLAFPQNSVIEVRDGEEWVIVGPKRVGSRLRTLIEGNTARFAEGAPPFHLSRMWLETSNGKQKFFLGNEPLNSRMLWYFDMDTVNLRFCMDRYCNAYYEEITNHG